MVNLFLRQVISQAKVRYQPAFFVGIGVKPHCRAVRCVPPVFKGHLSTHCLRVDAQLGEKPVDHITKFPPLQIVGAAQREHHLSALMKFVTFGMTTKVIVVLKQQYF